MEPDPQVISDNIVDPDLEIANRTDATTTDNVIMIDVTAEIAVKPLPPTSSIYIAPPTSPILDFNLFHHAVSFTLIVLLVFVLKLSFFSFLKFFFGESRLFKYYLEFMLKKAH